MPNEPFWNKPSNKCINSNAGKLMTKLMPPIGYPSQLLESPCHKKYHAASNATMAMKTITARLVLSVFIFLCWLILLTASHKKPHAQCRLTKKAEPTPTRDVDCNRSANGGWLRRLVRPHGHLLVNSITRRRMPRCEMLNQDFKLP